MRSKFLIKKPSKNDFNQIFKLLVKLYPKENLSKQKILAIYQDQLKKKNRIHLIAAIDGHIIGYAALEMRSDLQTQGTVGQLSELIVDEADRGNGIGTTLIAAIAKEAKRLKCVEIQVQSTFKRKKAHKFYERRGFKKKAYFFWKEI